MRQLHRSALFLAARALAFDTIPIREQPPTKAELNRMLAIYGGDLRRLFNTSGGDYNSLLYGPSGYGGGYTYGGSNSYGFTA